MATAQLYRDRDGTVHSLTRGGKRTACGRLRPSARAYGRHFGDQAVPDGAWCEGCRQWVMEHRRTERTIVGSRRTAGKAPKGRYDFTAGYGVEGTTAAQWSRSAARPADSEAARYATASAAQLRNGDLMRELRSRGIL